VRSLLDSSFPFSVDAEPCCELCCALVFYLLALDLFVSELVFDSVLESDSNLRDFDAGIEFEFANCCC
jgi:hypothetical protein